MQEKSSGFQWPAQWTPDILATLMFVVQKGRILLIRKKRGIGAGKVNGPGGKFEPGETALQCVLREVREELQIDIEDAVNNPDRIVPGNKLMDHKITAVTGINKTANQKLLYHCQWLVAEVSSLSRGGKPAVAYVLGCVSFL